MKKGFTLIELLCIIIILGVIALIAVPMVNTIITESKKESFKTTARSYANVAEKKCLQEQIKQKPITMRYKLENGKINPKLDIKGEVPEGYIYVNDKCEVTYELKNDKYIVYVERPNDDVILIDNTSTYQENKLSRVIIENNNVLNSPITRPGIDNSKQNEASLVKGTDNDGDTYYFRGNVTNNYVKLLKHPNDIWFLNNNYYNVEKDGATKIEKGSDMIFRIVRINGDGTIRLVLNESIATTSYSTTNGTTDAAKYMNSNAKIILDEWYKSIDDISNYTTQSKFCNDINMDNASFFSGGNRIMKGYEARNSNPSLVCNENSILNLQVGMLSADENAFAGIRYYDTEPNNYFYLNNNTYNWTMTPMTYMANSVFMSYSGDYLNYVGSGGNYGIRPVINLKPTVNYISGDGTISNPYIIR